MSRTMAYPVAAVAASSIGTVAIVPQTNAELRLPGTVEVQEVRLGSKLGGRIAEVLVREGENVEAGRGLVRVGTTASPGPGSTRHAPPALGGRNDAPRGRRGPSPRGKDRE